MGIPSLLQPYEFLQNTDPRAVLMYISMFKMKVEADPLRTTQNQVQQLSKLLLECADGVTSATDQFSHDCTKLRSMLSSVDVGEKEKYFEKRVTLMENMIREALDMVEDLDERNNLLAKENKLLTEQLTVCLHITTFNNISSDQYQRYYYYKITWSSLRLDS